MTDTSLRRSQVVQQEARRVLERFLRLYAELIPKEERTHFKNDFPPLSKSSEDSEKILLKLMKEMDWDDDLIEENMEIHRSGDRRDSEAFSRILQATASRRRPDQLDLDRLMECLNIPLGKLFYFGSSPLGRQLGKAPYDFMSKGGLREMAEILKEYLNMTDGPGPVHTSCKVCGLLMIKKRGGRKYCSAECSGKAWNYSARKDKLAAIRKIHRARAAKEAAALKVSQTKKSTRKGSK